MITAITNHIYALKYEYDIWMSQKIIRSYKKIIYKHEKKFNEKLEKITQKRDRKIVPYKQYISEIEVKITEYNNKINKLNYDF